MADRYAIGLDAGGTRLKAVAFDAMAGLELATTEFPTGAVPFPTWVPTLITLVREWTAQLGEPDAIGVAAPGLVDPVTQRVSWMVGHRADLVDVNFDRVFGRPVSVLNDGQAALYGEAAMRPPEAMRNVLMLTLGTGVGGAAIVDGRLLRGAIGRAGHLGHVSLDPEGRRDIVGTPGSLELLFGDATVPERSDGVYADTLELVTAHQAGDAWATEVWLKSVRALAAAIVSFVNVLDSDTVILAGGITNAGFELLGPLREELARFEWRPNGHQITLSMAQLGDRAGAVGAAAYALDQTK